MATQLRGDPLPMDRLLAGVMQNMDLPEGEEDFAGLGFQVYYDNRSRLSFIAFRLSMAYYESVGEPQ